MQYNCWIELILELSCLLFRINKKNSIEFPLDLDYYLYLLHMVYTTNPNLLMIYKGDWSRVNSRRIFSHITAPKCITTYLQENPQSLE